eukprot:9488906-Pyramimonas_sp.AAC.4
MSSSRSSSSSSSRPPSRPSSALRSGTRSALPARSPRTSRISGSAARGKRKSEVSSVGDSRSPRASNVNGTSEDTTEGARNDADETPNHEDQEDPIMAAPIIPLEVLQCVHRRTLVFCATRIPVRLDCAFMFVVYVLTCCVAQPSGSGPVCDGTVASLPPAALCKRL